MISKELLQLIPDAVIVIDANGKVVLANDSIFKIFGWAPEELQGSPMSMLLEKSKIEKHRGHIQNFFKNPIQRRMGVGQSLNGIDRNGNTVDIDIALGSFEHDGQQLAIAVVRDIGDRLAMERQMRSYMDELRKVNKQLEHFASIISHDLKAPLRAIKSISEWIIEDLQGKMEPETEYNLQLLGKRVQRMESLVNGVLEYSKIGHENLENEIVNVYALVGEIIDAQAPPEHFRFIVDPDIHNVRFPRILMQQVLANLISNAVKYYEGDAGVVKIGSRDLGDAVEYFVEDNGPGIPEDYHEKIFGIFETIGSRLKPDSTGIGLALVKKILEEKNGRIWVDSSYQTGTRFKFVIKKQQILQNQSAADH